MVWNELNHLLFDSEGNFYLFTCLIAYNKYLLWLFSLQIYELLLYS
jgi:hypothetical protein